MPNQTLRKNIIFVVDNETVVIGARPFARQPKMRGAVSIPQLLDQGGVEEIITRSMRSAEAYYAPRPFTGPTMDPAERKFRQLIESEPLR